MEGVKARVREILKDKPYLMGSGTDNELIAEYCRRFIRDWNKEMKEPYVDTVEDLLRVIEMGKLPKFDTITKDKRRIVAESQGRMIK